MYVAVVNDFDYVFSENGLVAFFNGEKIHSQSFKDHLGEENLKRFINWTLKRLSEMDCPQKRGNFIEFRTGMINVSVCGRNVNQAERDGYAAFDDEVKQRAGLVKDWQEAFPELGLRYSIGGQISVDVFPEGWDKTYCLQHVASRNFEEIHFFGDKTHEGGNDYEIYNHPGTIGHAVTKPDDTMEILRKEFLARK
jgi:phosphomannomutase